MNMRVHNLGVEYSIYVCLYFGPAYSFEVLRERMEYIDIFLFSPITGCWFVGGDDLTGALHDL